MTPTAMARACEVCGSADRDVLFHQRFGGDLDGALVPGYDVAICNACGFGYADGLPSQAAFDVYYERMSKYEYGQRGGRESAFEEQRFPAAAAFIREYVRDTSARVLDVGCSNGGLLNALRAEGFSRLMGLDPSPTCAGVAQELYGLRVLTGTLSSPPTVLGRHDVVLLSAVLEHIRDLRVALRQVGGILESDGTVYVEVPDVTRFGGHPDAPFQEFSVEHINYFSPRSLCNLFEANGFVRIAARTVTTSQGEDTTADVIMAAFRASDGACLPPTPDEVTRPALVRYIASCRQIERDILAAIMSVVESGTEIIVWGVGTHTQRLLAETPLGRARIVAFVDSNPRYRGKTLNGLPVLAPTGLRGREEPILVSSRSYQREIERQVRTDLRLPNELILLYRL
jgi:SAM-dependent methyltransferase